MALSASFISWLDQPMKTPVVWAVLTAIDSSGAEVYYWFGSDGRTLDADDTPTPAVDGGYIPGDLSGWPVPLIAAALPFSSTAAAAAGGEPIVIANLEGTWDALSDLNWRGEVQEIRMSDATWNVEDAEAVYTMTADFVQDDEDQTTLVLADPSAPWSRNVQSARYQSVTLNPSLNGQVADTVLGRVYHAKPSEIDPTTEVFRFHIDAEVNGDAVFGNGYELELPEGIAVEWSPTDQFLTAPSISDFEAFQNTARRGYRAADTSFEAGDPPKFFQVRILQHTPADVITGNEAFEIGLGPNSGFNITPPAHGGGYSAGYSQFVALLPGIRYADDGTIIVQNWSTTGQKTLTGPPLREGDIVGWRVTPPASYVLSHAGAYLVEIWHNATPVASVLLSSKISTGTPGPWTPSPTVAGHEISYGFVWYCDNDPGTAQQRLELLTDSWKWVEPPSSVVPADSVGRYGEYDALVDDNEIQLLGTNQQDLITMDASWHSPVGFAEWSVAAGIVISGTKSRTVTQDGSGIAGALLPLLRSFGRQIVEYDIVSVNSSGFPQVGLTSFNASDTAASRLETAGNAYFFRAALLADGGAVRENAIANVIGVPFATGDIMAFETDPDNDAYYVWKNGSANGPYVMTDWLRAVAKGPFSASDYYELDDGLAFSSSDLLVISMRVEIVTTAANEFIFTLDGNRVRLFKTAVGYVRMQTFDATNTLITDHQTAAPVPAGIHSLLLALDAVTGVAQIYLDDVSSLTSSVTTGGQIGWNVSASAVGSAVSGGGPFSGKIHHLGVCTGVDLDLSSEAIRRRFFRKDGFPSALAGRDGRGAFGQVPELWITSGNATQNLGTAGAFDEVGTVPDSTVAGDLTTPIAPVVFLETKGDVITVNTNVADMSYDYDRNGIGSNGGLPELLQQLEPLASPIDRQQVFESTAQSGFAPSLGDYIRDDKDARALAEELSRSCGASMYFDEYSLARLFYLVNPDAANAVGTIALDDLVEGTLLSRRQDRGESLATTVHSWEIQTPHRDTEIVFDAERKDILINAYGIKTTAFPLLDPLYATVARTREAIRTKLTDGDPLDDAVYRAGELLLERLMGLYTQKRWVVSLEHFQVPAELDIGQVWLLDTMDPATGDYRWDLNAKPHLVIARPAIRGFQGLLEFWG